MRKLLFLIILLPGLLFFTCEADRSWDGIVSYEVTGDATDVSIRYMGSNTVIDSTTLPWSSGDISAHSTSDSGTYSCYVEVTNNTSDDVTITVKIFVNGTLKKIVTGSGPDCVVIANYDVIHY
jgi:hypothetical protein